MKIPKPSDADKDYFRSIVPDDPRVVVKPMFGNVAAFVNGNMFIGLFGSDVGVRLAEQDRSVLMDIEGAGTFGPPERPMREYVSMPIEWRDDTTAADEWVAKALEHTAAMPPKKKKKR